MMRSMTIIFTVGATLTLGACANDTLFGEAAMQPTAALPAKPATDPACPALASRIDELRRDGVVERVDAVAKGKGTSVKVKRASLAQIAELDRANAEFQAKCSTVPRSATAPRQQATSDQKAEAVIAKARATSSASTATKQ